MISYQVIQPFLYNISGNTLNEAIKNFVKIHHELNLQNIIIADQRTHYQSNLRYFYEDGRNRVGINTYPYSGPIAFGPTYATYIDEPFTPSVQSNSNLWNTNVPISSYGITSPYVPTIITYR